MPSSEDLTPPTLGTRPTGGARGAQRTRIGPIALVLPLCTLILGILWMRHWRPRAESEHATPPVPVAGEVQGWVASRFLAGDAALTIQIARLHTDEARQALEQRVLGARFGREEGEPFRIVLTLRAPAGAASGLELDAAGVRIVDATGLALEPIVARVPAKHRALADPLKTLLTPPHEKLTAGREVSLVLWGRPPGAGARVEGLGDPLPLTSRPVPRADLARSLARLDRSGEESR